MKRFVLETDETIAKFLTGNPVREQPVHVTMASYARSNVVVISRAPSGNVRSWPIVDGAHVR